MPFDRPSLAQLIERSQATLSAKLGASAPMLARTPENALCNMSAALADGCHGHLDYLAKQLFPGTCDEVFLGLHAAARGVPRKEGESVDDWRRRVATDMRDPPSGGDSPDFVAWATAVPGVARAWVRPCWQGLGTVGVLFAAAGDYDPVHAAGLRGAVQAALDGKPPQGVERTAIVPAARRIDLRLKLYPNTEAVQKAVLDAVREFLRELEPGELMLLSRLRRAITSANGLIDHRVHLPWSDVHIEKLSLPVLGDVEFSDLFPPFNPSPASR